MGVFLFCTNRSALLPLHGTLRGTWNVSLPQSDSESSHDLWPLQAPGNAPAHPPFTVDLAGPQPPTFKGFQPVITITSTQITERPFSFDRLE